MLYMDVNSISGSLSPASAPKQPKLNGAQQFVIMCVTPYAVGGRALSLWDCVHPPCLGQGHTVVPSPLGWEYLWG